MSKFFDVKERFSMKIKKRERLFTPIASFKHLVELIGARGEKVAFEYPVGKGYQTVSYADFSSSSAKGISLSLASPSAGARGMKVLTVG